MLTGWKLTSVPRCLHSAVEWRLRIWWRCCLVHFEDSQPKPCICPETNAEGKAVVRVFNMSNTEWMCSLLLILVRKQAVAFETIWRETTWVLFLGKSKNNTVNQVWHIKAWTNVWCAFLLSHITIWHVVCFIVNNCSFKIRTRYPLHGWLIGQRRKKLNKPAIYIWCFALYRMCLCSVSPVAPEPPPPCQMGGKRPDLQTTPPDPRRCLLSDELRANLRHAQHLGCHRYWWTTFIYCILKAPCRYLVTILGL